MRFSGFLPLLFTLAGIATGQTKPQEMLLADRIENDVQLVALDQAHLRVESKAGERRISLDDLVRWGGLSERSKLPTVVLRDGSVLVGAPSWTRVGSISLADGVWRVRSTSLQSVRIKSDRVRAVWLGAAGEGGDNAAVRRGSAVYRGDKDRVWLTSGDALDGRVVSLARKKLVLETFGTEVEIEFKKIAALALTGDAAAANAGLAVGLKDGSLLYAKHAKLSGDQFEVTLLDDVKLLGAGAANVTFLQSFGGRSVYLSDLTPINYKHTPYLSVRWPLAKDQGLSGRPLQASGHRVLKGLAMHSASRVVYRLDGGFERFQAEVAIDQNAGSAPTGGSVTFTVLVARDSGFEVAWESEVVRSGQAPLPVSVDIAGAKAIALLVDYADYGDQQDHADWLDARLVRADAANP